MNLPIAELRAPLIAAAAKYRRLILTAPTGSGKSTQVPQFLLDAGKLDTGQVVILQPRRLPARLLAGWVAQSRGGKVGDEVGYQIRLDNVTSAKTRIRYVTEGILLRQMLNDSTLSGISAILFDEFHERHLYGDITLARALQIQETTRPDLLIIVMSATLDVAAVEKYLQPCLILESKGRTFPVETQYLTQSVGDMPVWDVAAEECERLVRQHREGDVLIFMPGGYEISRTVQAVKDMLGSKFMVLPLHGELPPHEQDAAVARYDLRKVVVATNVAETSLTIDGVRLVIDSGLARIPRYDPHRGINTLLIEKISRASADQRTGRAGRTAPGISLRLWTEREHESRPAQELPEIKRLDLAEVVLTLKASGVDDVKSFRWLEAPDPRSLERAETLLVDLGALSSSAAVPAVPPLATQQHGRDARATGITPLGRRMLAFPLHPRYSRMLLAAHEFGCVRQIALIAALTQGRSLLTRGDGKQIRDSRDELFGGENASDMFVLMRAWRYADRNGYDLRRCKALGIHALSARQVGPLYEQFIDIARREKLDVSEKQTTNEAIQRCILVGFSDHLAKRCDAGTLRCDIVHGRRGVLARESVVTAPVFVATEIAEIQGKELNVLLNLCTAIKEEWLRDLFPEDFEEKRDVAFDTTTRRVVCRVQRKFRDLVLESKPTDDVPREDAARILAVEVVAKRLVLNEWNEAVEQWILRLNWLREWMPELELPCITEEDRATLIEQLCLGAFGYKDIKDKPVWPVVKSWLSSQQQAWVEEYTPERIELKSGRRAKVTYSPDGPPTLAARIQDLYGTNSLTIASGRVALRIEVLAPNNRPIQTTENLLGFWREQYPKLKIELQRKYPKHEWR
ncbi:MAG: ATP-dependent helicase HrpB [Verrucomicrobiota bacterium]